MEKSNKKVNAEKISKAKERKSKEVEEMKKLFAKYSVVGIIDMFKTPAITMQNVKKKSRGKTVIKMTKRAVLMRSLEGVKDKKKNFEHFEKLIPQNAAIFFTDDDPFKFYATVDKLKTPAAAKKVTSLLMTSQYQLVRQIL